MSLRSFAGIAFWALTAGGVIAILSGENRAISLRVWLATFALWFAWSAVKALLVVAPRWPVPSLGFLQADKEPLFHDDDRLREVRALHALLLRSRDNERAYGQQLRPRLIALSDHYLLVKHGVDAAREPARAASVLGDLAWMVDVDDHERAPSLDEVDRLLDYLMNEPEHTKDAA